MTLLVKLIAAAKFMFWAAVIILVFSYSTEIGGFLTGIVDRVDYFIGYEP